MRDDPLYLAWDVLCSSEGDARRVADVLQREARPDSVLVDIAATGDPALALDRITSYRVGEFFREVIVFPALDGDLSKLRVVFSRLPSAGRFWKDAMTRLLQAARETTDGVSVRLAYRGDEPRDWEHYQEAA